MLNKHYNINYDIDYDMLIKKIKKQNNQSIFDYFNPNKLSITCLEIDNVKKYLLLYKQTRNFSYLNKINLKSINHIDFSNKIKIKIIDLEKLYQPYPIPWLFLNQKMNLKIDSIETLNKKKQQHIITIRTDTMNKFIYNCLKNISLCQNEFKDLNKDKQLIVQTDCQQIFLRLYQIHKNQKIHFYNKASQLEYNENKHCHIESIYNENYNIKSIYNKNICNILQLLKLHGFMITHLTILNYMINFSNSKYEEAFLYDQTLNQKMDKYIAQFSIIFADGNMYYFGYDANNNKKIIPISIKQNNSDIHILTNQDNIKAGLLLKKTQEVAIFRILFDHEQLHNDIDNDADENYYKQWLKLFDNIKT